MADPKFYSHLFPFDDPSVLVNGKHLTDSQVVQMHEEDAAKEVIKSDDDSPALEPSQLSQLPTQPARAPPFPPEDSTRQLRPRTHACTTPGPSQPPALLPSLPHTRAGDGRGEDAAIDAPIAAMSDTHLSRALVHHKVILTLPKTWWVHPDTNQYQECTIMPTRCYSEKKYTYLDADVLQPTDLSVSTEMKIPVSWGEWSVRSLLNIRFNYPRTLLDIGVSARTQALSS
eukprot:2100518-Rhodomonas_salina.1